MKKLFYISIFTIFLLALIVLAGKVSSLKSEANGEAEEVDSSAEALVEADAPQWFSQWYEMKKDASGNIPMLMSHQWMGYDAMNKTNATPLLDSIKNLGPSNIGGRTRAILVDWSDTTHYFAGSVAGGLWESRNEGTSWKPVNDNAENLNITALTQNPFNANIIYYSTGEPYPVADASSNTGGQLGGGIFKSVDGGKTFSVLPSTLNTNFTSAWDIKHSLKDSNTVFVATDNKGLWRSKDGGLTFTNVFPSSNAFTRIEILADGSIIVSQSTMGIYKSSNGDPGTFNLLSNGFATGAFGLIDFAVCKNFPNVMFAAVSASGNGSMKAFYRSSDGGQSWRTITTANVGYGYTWFCLTTAICPTDTNRMFIGSVNIAYTINGGQTWTSAMNAHSDYHLLYTVPGSSKLLCGNDGGIWRYNWKTPGSFEDLNNGYTVTQYYAGSFFPTGLSAIMGAQDNGSHRLYQADPDVISVYGADGAFTGINQKDANKGYVSWQSAGLLRANNLKGNPSTTGISFSSPDGKWFINPFEINNADGNQLYIPTKSRVYRIIGTSYTPITNIFPKQPYSLGISNDSTPVIYVGGQNMLLARIANGLTATPGGEVMISNIPAGLNLDFIGSIKVHPNDVNTIYITLTNYSNAGRVWKITNTNTTPVWTDISGNMPQSLPCNTIEVDPVDPDNKIIVGTDFGLYATSDGGVTWIKENRIPNVCIYNIRLRARDRKLFIFSHGRGLWVADIMPFIAARPTAGISASKTLLCQGESVSFKDNSDFYPTNFQWTFPGGSPGTSFNRDENVVFNTPGTITVKLKVSNASGADSSTVQLTIVPSPKPFILRANDSTLQCSTTNSVTFYEWYFNNQSQVDHFQTMKILGAGWYKVMVYNGNNCFAFSDSLQVFPVGIKGYAKANEVSAWPNPGMNILNIYTPSKSAVQFYSMDGKLIKSIHAETGLRAIDVSSLSRGIYLLVFINEEKRDMIKWVKE
jgi:PKD repeat protein